jgi:hypothetical protein
MFKQAFYDLLRVLDQEGFHQHASSLKSQAERTLTEEQAGKILAGFRKVLRSLEPKPETAPDAKPATPAEPATAT